MISNVQSILKKILIVTEAGKKIGFGHYIRCSALRDQLESIGIVTVMYVFAKDYNLEDKKVIKENWIQNLEVLNEYKSCDLVLIDSYLSDFNVYQKIKNTFNVVVAIDDYNRISYPVNCIINPNLSYKGLEYRNQTASAIGG